MQISHTVYRGRNNEIVLQLLSAGAPLASPSSIDKVEMTLRSCQLSGVAAAPVTVDSQADSDAVDYDEAEGTVSMKLGRIAEVIALADGAYDVQVIAFGPDNIEGLAFGSFLIYLTDWGGEVPSGS
jgi:hypothetical protein